MHQIYSERSSTDRNAAVLSAADSNSIPQTFCKNAKKTTEIFESFDAARSGRDLFTAAIIAICSTENRCRRDASVLTQMEVGEHTPRFSCLLSLLGSHGVLSLLGNTEVYCSMLVSSLSLSLS